MLSLQKSRASVPLRLVIALGLIIAGLSVWFLGLALPTIRVASAACTGQNTYLGSYYLLPDDGSHPDFEQVLQQLQDVPGQLQANLVNGLPVPTNPNPPQVNGQPGNTSIRQFDWYTSKYQIFTRLDNNPLAFSNDNTPNTRPYFGPTTTPAASAALPANKDLFAAHWRTNLVAPPGGLSIPYSFALDDAGWVFVDGVLQVDHGGIHPPATFTGNFVIGAGRHTIDIFFADRHTVNAVTNIQLGNLGAVLDCGSPILTLNKTVQPSGPVNPGDVLTYTIQATNTGNFTATNVLIRDQMPAGTSLVSVSPTAFVTPGIGGNGELVWSFPSLVPGQTANVTFSVQVGASVPPASLLANQALATSEESGGVVFKSNAVSNVVNATAVIGIEKSATPPPGTTVNINDTVTYVITVTNNGNVPTSSVVVTDPIPAGTAYVSANPLPSSTAGGNVRWLLSPIPPGATQTLQLTVRVTGRPLSGNLQNQAIAESNGTVRSPTVSHQVGESADLSLLKQISGINPPGAPVSGTQITYVLQSFNPGPSSATNAVLTDTIPPGTQLVSSVPTPTTQSGQNLTWNFGTIGAGQTRSVTVVVQVVTNTVPANLTNRARISSPVNDINPLNNDATASVPGNAAPNDATASKSGPPKVVPGTDIFVYDIVVRSTLGGANVVVTDTLPTEVVLVPERTNPPAFNLSGNTYQWIIGQMAPNSTFNIQVGVRLSPSASPGVTISNQANITSGDGPTRTTSISNQANTQVISPSNVTLSKRVVSPQAFNTGDSVTFELTVRNNAANPSGVVTVTDTLPGGTAFEAAGPAGVPSSVNGTQVVWTIPSVPANGTTVLTLQVRVTDPNVRTLNNRASLQTDAPGSEPSVLSNPVSIPRVGLTANLTLNKNSTAQALQRGGTFAYTIEAANTSPDIEAKNVIVSDVLPPELIYISSQPAPVSQNPLTWNLGNMPPGGRATITLIVQLRQNVTGGRVVNQASASFFSGGSQSGSQFAVKEIPILAPPASATPALTVRPGEQATSTPAPTSTAAATTTEAVTETLTATPAASLTSEAVTTLAATATSTAVAGTTTTSAGATQTASSLPGFPNTGKAGSGNELDWPGTLAQFVIGAVLIGGGIMLIWPRRRRNQSGKREL